MTDLIRDALLIAVILLALRNYLFVSRTITTDRDVVMGWVYWLACRLGLRKPDPHGGNVNLRPSKGTNGRPNGVVRVYDAHGNVCEEWPKQDAGGLIIGTAHAHDIPKQKKDPVTGPAIDFHKKDE